MKRHLLTILGGYIKESYRRFVVYLPNLPVIIPIHAFLEKSCKVIHGLPWGASKKLDSFSGFCAASLLKSHSDSVSDSHGNNENWIRKISFRIASFSPFFLFNFCNRSAPLYRLAFYFNFSRIDWMKFSPSFLHPKMVFVFSGFVMSLASGVVSFFGEKIFFGSTFLTSVFPSIARFSQYPERFNRFLQFAMAALLKHQSIMNFIPKEAI